MENTHLQHMCGLVCAAGTISLTAPVQSLSYKYTTSYYSMRILTFSGKITSSTHWLFNRCESKSVGGVKECISQTTDLVSAIFLLCKNDENWFKQELTITW